MSTTAGLEMGLGDALRSRRSVRGFLPHKPVPKALLERALEAAQLSPSNCNAQPWQVFVVQGQVRDELSAALVQAAREQMPPSESPTPAFAGLHRRRQVACAVELYGKLGVQREDHAGRERAALRNFQLFDAPCVLVLCMDESFGVGVALDVGIYLQSLMLSLRALGLSSCAMASLRSYPDIIKAKLQIPEHLRILVGVAVGYEDPTALANQVRQPRAPISENCTFIGFDASSD